MMTKNFILGTFNVLVKIVVFCIAIYIIVYGGKTGFETGYSLMAKDSSDAVGIVDVEVEIPKGASTEEIANILKENNLISSALYFRIIAKFYGNDSLFQYGSYVFNTGMDEEEIMSMLLTEGEKRETVQFTIPEGYTVEQIADKLDNEGICEGSDFLEAVYEANYGYKFMDQIPERNVKLQGYLFPDTYEVYTDASAEDIISTMLKRFDSIFTDEYYARAEELGYSVDEIITIASIIEKEVKVPTERATVSGVIYNRLNIEMNLEMCSTVMYALGKPRERLLYEDLEIESPYNTYINSGLPVGPIANPGAESIKAALYPEDHDYLFFVLVNEETGEHQFNTTLDAHNAAKHKYDQEF